MQETVTACLPAFQINRILILIIQVEGRIVQRKRGYGLGIQIGGSVGFQRCQETSVPVVGGLGFVLLGAEAKRRSLNRNFAGVDDIVVNRNILVGQTVFVQHAVAGERKVVVTPRVSHISA